jgi:methylglutaconyl-CoA hydratase
MIRTETQDGVRSIVFDRPEKRNALTPGMLDELVRGVRAVTLGKGPDAGVRAVLLRGEGKSFCAGFDLDLCRDDGPEQTVMRSFLTLLSSAVEAMRACPRPVVIACQGAAVAGGCALLGGADLVVADRGAKLGYPVVRLGISPAVSAPFLMDGAGPGGARRRLLDHRLFDGAEGARIGLVHELVEGRDEVAPRAHAIASSMAGKSVHAMKATKAWALDVAGEKKMPGRAARALDASLSLITGNEARERLASVWKNT